MIYPGDYGEDLNKINKIKKLLGDNVNIMKNGDVITADWNKIKIIFTTPSILYDEIKTHKVYGYYFKNSVLDSMLCNQQLNRIRSPISFDLYIEKHIEKPFSSLEACRKYIFNNDLEDFCNDKRKNVLARSAADELFIFDRYIQSYYNDLFYFVPYLLKKKGYTNINVIVEDEVKQTKYTAKKYNDILIKEFNDGTLDNKKKYHVLIYLRSYGFDKQFVKSDPKLNKIEKEIRDNAIDVFIDEKNVRCLQLYHKWHNKTFENNLFDYNDTNLIKKYSDDYKLKLLDDLHTALGVEWFDTNLLEKLKKDDNLMRHIDVPKHVFEGMQNRDLFYVRSKKPITYIDWVSFLLKRYTVFSNSVIKCHHNNLSVTINGDQRQFSVPTIGPFVERLKFIINYEKEIMNIKEIYDKNRPTFHDEYLF